MAVTNQKQWQYLKRLAEADKLPHALLVSGVSSAEFFSRIFGENITNRTHPDFFIVEPIKVAEALPNLPLRQEVAETSSNLSPSSASFRTAKEIKIPQIRECIWRLSLKPSIAPFKVAVIDQAHLMNSEAQAALLKTLEEPKGKTLLILITDYPDALFPTIISRTQRIRFHQINAYQKSKEKIGQEITKLTKSDLVTRFQYAEKIAKSQELKEILTAWLDYLRQDLVKNKKILQRIQTTYYLISKTNINPRLALETLMLEL